MKWKTLIMHLHHRSLSEILCLRREQLEPAPSRILFHQCPGEPSCVGGLDPKQELGGALEHHRQCCSRSMNAVTNLNMVIPAPEVRICLMTAGALLVTHLAKGV